MHTVQLNIHDSVYDSFLNYVGKFKNNEVKIIEEKRELTLAEKRLLANREYIRKEIEDMDSGKAEFISQEEFEKNMDDILAKYEN
jgi:hypothetical protein